MFSDDTGVGRLAVAHKDYDVRGGGEALAEHLARVFDAPLYVGRRDPACEPEGSPVDIRELFPSRLAHWAIDKGGLTRSLAYQTLWQHHTGVLGEFDTVILSGNEPLWWIPRDTQTVIAYTHSTPRHLYDLYPDIGDDLGSRIHKTVLGLQRWMYQQNVTRPDLWVANSDLVARRIQRYWGIPAEKVRVVYPPVETTSFGQEYAADAPEGPYFVTIGRLCAEKHVDRIIRAFDGLDATLLVAGTGPEEAALRDPAGDLPNVELLGYISEERKRALLAGAEAFIFSGRNEDFGMSPIEAFASGTPVIGVRDGFTRYQVLDGKNGIQFPVEGGEQSLRAGIERFLTTGVTWSAADIERFADCYFSVEAFREGMVEAVDAARQQTRVTVPWSTSYSDDASASDPASRQIETSESVARSRTTDHARTDGGHDE